MAHVPKFLLASTLACFVATTSVAQEQIKLARIGVLAFRGNEKSTSRWAPTADYLSSSIRDSRFRIVPLSLAEMTTAARDGSVDFILTNPGNYVNLEARFGVTRIATLKSPKTMAEANVFGAVIFVRSVRKDIQSLKDLRGKKFMAVSRHAFGGFQMAWRKLKASGIDPFEDFSELRFSGFPQDQIAMAVLQGKVDAGTLRTGVLQDMVTEKKVKISDFRVLGEVRQQGFRLPVSTRLYPEWPFSQLRGTHPGLAQQVAIALLEMPANAPAAIAGNYAGWTVPLDYQPVHQLFRELQIGPYADIGKFTPGDVIKRYGLWLALGLLALVMIVGWTAWVEYLVNRRTRELSLANVELAREIEERHKAEEIAARREQELAQIGRLNMVGEMASGLAHELNNPLAAIINYANGGIRRLKSGAGDNSQLLQVLELMSGQAQQAADIIRSIRDLVRKEKGSRKTVSMNTVLRDISGLLEVEARRNDVQLRLNFDERCPQVHVDAVQVEQVILNLARNAIDAMAGNSPDNRLLSVATLDSGDKQVELAVKDSGSGIAADLGDTVFNPFVTTKIDGLGFGLSISKTIVEAHGGRLWTEASSVNGTEIRFSIPVAELWQ